MHLLEPYDPLSPSDLAVPAEIVAVTSQVDSLRAGPNSTLTARVLARLPEADRQRARLQRRRKLESLVVALLAVTGLFICGLPQASHLATHALAWVLAAGVAWTDIVRVLLDGLTFVPTIAAVCLLATGFVLWHRVIAPAH